MKQILIITLTLLITLPLPVRGSTEAPILSIDTGGHMAVIRDVMFTKDGRYLVSASEDKTIRVWDVKTGGIAQIIRGQIGEGPEGQIFAAALSPDNQWLAVGGFMANFTGNNHKEIGKIRLIDFRTGEIKRLLKGHRSVISGIAFSPDSRRIVSGSGDKTARIWDVKTGKTLHTLSGHTDYIYAVAFSPDGKRAITGSDDDTLRLWNVRTDELITKLIGHTDNVVSSAFTPDGKYLLSGSWDKTIRLWDGKSGRFIKVLGRQDTTIANFSITPDGQKVLTGSGEGIGITTNIFSIPDGQKLVSFTKHENIVLATAISPDGRLATTGGGNEKEIYLWDIYTGKVRQKMVGKGKIVFSVGFGKDGWTVAWGKTDPCPGDNCRPQNFIDILEQSFCLSESGERFSLNLGETLTGDTGYIQGKEAVGNISIRTPNGQIHPTLQILHNGRVKHEITRKSTDGYDHRSLTLTPNGKITVSGGGNGVLTSYNTQTGTKLQDFIGHTGDVWGVAVSPDGNRLISGSSDQTVKLWDIAIGKNLLTIFHGSDNEWVAWTSEGYYTSSEKGGRYVGYHINRGEDQSADFISSEQMQAVFYRPDLVAAKLEGRTIAGMTDVASFLAKTGPPVVRILRPDDRSRVTGDTVTMRYTIEDGGGGIGSVRIYLNGTAVESEGRRGIKRKDKNETVREMTLGLQPGQDNLISVVAWDEKDELKSKEASVHVFSEAAIRKPGFFALVVGINEFSNPDISLRFARPDAQAVAELLKSRPSVRLFKNRNIRLLTDADATVENIRLAMESLKKNTKPEDVVMIYMASHGEIREDRYFLLTSSADYLMTEDLEKTCMMEEELRDRLSDIPAGKKLLLLDTCKSGKMVQAMNRGLSESTTMELLARTVGSYVIAASTEAQYASEGYNGHGLFTYVLLEGLKGAADLDQNGVVEVDELKLYVKREVPELSKKHFGRRQLPVATGTGESFPLMEK